MTSVGLKCFVENVTFESFYFENMKEKVVLLFAIFAIASGAVSGASQFDPSWLIYKPSSTSETPATTKKIGADSVSGNQGKEMPKQENQIQYKFCMLDHELVL